MGDFIRKLSYSRLIAISFLLIILLGSVLLMLPISSREGLWTPFLDCLFTATSATCVTGLAIYDTYTYWSYFGQIVILLMIQVGGIGLMTFICMFAIFMKKKISLHERIILMQSAGNMRVSGVIVLVKRILQGTFLIEGIGTVLLMFVFCPKQGLGKGFYFSVFHAVSAFCNAGFDLMGEQGNFSSFIHKGFYDNVLLNLTIMMLIIIGGIGFVVWSDVLRYKWKLKEYSLQSKIVLSTTFMLLIIGTILFLITEYHAAMAEMTFGNKLLASAFLSVSTRTAGFSSVDAAGLSDAGSIVADAFMFIGGSPGSTAGGIKTTTAAVLFFSIFAMARGKSEVTVFKRRLEENLIKQAAVIGFIYIVAICLAAAGICFLEHAPMKEVLFETISAAGTVGLSMGLTTQLGVISRLILIILMYGGRIGGLSLLLVFAERRSIATINRPSEKILIG